MKSFISWPKLFLIFLLILAFLWLISCNTASHNAKAVNKAILYYPAQTAKQFSDKWPCVPVATISDSADYKQYRAELAAFIESNKIIPAEAVTDTIMEIWADTAKIKALRKQVVKLQDKEKYLNKYISDLTELCKDKPPIHDTIFKDDYAKIQVYTSQAEQLNNEKNNYIGKYERASSLNFWLIAFLLCSTVLNIIQIKVKKWRSVNSTTV